MIPPSTEWSAVVTETSPTLALALDVAELSARYEARTLIPAVHLESLRQSIQARGADGIWVAVVSAEALRAAVDQLEKRRAAGEALPLYGIPFAVKDNLDVVGFPTTAACPAFAYAPSESAFVVDRLVRAGAVVMGKTNMDQFATGLVGVRSPFGIPQNPFNPEFVTGGSSSGSAAAVARGQVTFSLGTDTAGSGRVPAAFNNIVGLKPSRGVLSATGVVPACRALDCVSVFAGTCEDAAVVAEIMRGYDARDPYARPNADTVAFRGARLDSGGAGEGDGKIKFRFGMLPAADREFLGDKQAAAAYDRAIADACALGGVPVVISFEPFRRVGAMLYEGPFVAERLEAAGALFAREPSALVPPLRAILEGAGRHTAASAYMAEAELRRVRRQVDALWSTIDCLLLPTAPTHPRIADVEREPLKINAAIGLYTTFVNLLDLAALAVPAGFREDGLPTGITFMGPWGSDARLFEIGTRFHRRTSTRLGATSLPLPPTPTPIPIKAVTPKGAEDSGMLPLVVVGAHLSGQPLNHELSGVGGRLKTATKTAARYRLYALAGTVPPKPGLVRVADDDTVGKLAATAIDVEVWLLPEVEFARFVSRIPSPLGVGKVELQDGSVVTGFVCEPHAIAHAIEISSFGGWRAYRASRT